MLLDIRGTHWVRPGITQDTDNETTGCVKASLQVCSELLSLRSVAWGDICNQALGARTMDYIVKTIIALYILALIILVFAWDKYQALLCAIGV